MKVKPSDLIAIAQILDDIGVTLVECGIDEWSSLEDCVKSIKANVEFDLNEHDF